MYEDLGYELAYSVQLDAARMLELMVDEVETGDCIWQIVDNAGRILEQSDTYQDQAVCLRDGLNHALPA